MGAFVGYIGEINEGELGQPGRSGLQGRAAGRQAGTREAVREASCAVARAFSSSRSTREIASCRTVARARTSRRRKGRRSTRTSTSICRSTSTSSSPTRWPAPSWRWSRRPGEVLALYSSPAHRPEPIRRRRVERVLRFVCSNDPRQPLYNKALQGQYPPGSTFKLATSVIALEDSLIDFNTHMPQSCNGYLLLRQSPVAVLEEGRARQPRPATARSRSRATSTSISSAKESALTRFVAGGVCLGFDKTHGHRSARGEAADLSDERPGILQPEVRRQGMDVGREGAEPGDRSGRELADRPQHGALLQRARDGRQRAHAEIKRGAPQRSKQNQHLAPDQMALLRKAMMGVVARVERRPRRRSRA